MPSSWSSSLRFELQFTGENINLWGDKLNAVLGHADYAIAGWLNKPLTGNYTLTSANAADDEARAAMVRFTGTGPFTVTIPSVPKKYLVWNACAGVLTLTTGAGSTVSIDPGDRTVVFCDGANVSTISFGGLDLKSFISTSALAATGALPAAIGNTGRALMVRDPGTGPVWTPSSIQTSDVQNLIPTINASALAFALALGGS